MTPIDKLISREGVRQFWVKATRVRNGLKSYTATIAPINVAGEFHVIEASHVAKLEAALKVAVKSLASVNNRYVQCEDCMARENISSKALADIEKIAGGE